MNEPEQKPKTLEINLFETIIVRDSVGLKSFIGSAKKFVGHIISGWFPSDRTDLSPEGVIKEQFVNRRDNRYKKRVIDFKTGRIIRDVDKKLTDHK